MMEGDTRNRPRLQSSVVRTSVQKGAGWKKFRILQPFHVVTDQHPYGLKMKMVIPILFSCLVIVAVPVEAHQHRSYTAKHAFRQMNPCPATGAVLGRCPGYVIDHVKPLACGGDDHPSNMQWQSVADAKAKDRWERKTCSRRYRIKRGGAVDRMDGWRR